MPPAAGDAHVGPSAVAQPAVAAESGSAGFAARFRGRDGRFLQHKLDGRRWPVGRRQPKASPTTDDARRVIAAPVLVGRRVRPVAGVYRHGFHGRPEADHSQGAHFARGTAQLGHPSNVIIS